MKMSERKIKTEISKIVADCRKYVFDQKDHQEIRRILDHASAQLSGIALLFPEGKMCGFIKTYSAELSGIRTLSVVDSQAHETHPLQLEAIDE
ncbi:MAG: hypothetical protein M0R41_06870 [Methylobacter tundripaludum]|nr:hypothetical protein [Methylobacter tundripaludum]